LRIRSGAGTNHSIVTTLSKSGTVLTVVSGKLTDSWIKVKTSDGKHTGFVSTAFVKANTAAAATAKPTATAKPATTLVSIKTTVASLRIRSGAGTKHSIVTTLSKSGTVLDVVSGKLSDSWIKVKTTDGKHTGYVSTAYVQSHKTVTATPKPTAKPTATPKPTASAKPATATPKPTAAPSASVTKIQTTAAGLRIRSGAGASHSIVTTLSKSGTVLDVVSGKLSDSWIKVKTTDGKHTGYVSTAYVKAYSAPSSNTGTSTSSSRSVPVGKTLYLKASASSWTSSDTSIATVSKGFVLGKKTGKVTITAKNSSGATVSNVTVSVTAAESVRVGYTAQNIAPKGSNVDLKAITDTSRTAVRFTITAGPSMVNRQFDTKENVTEKSTSTPVTSVKIWNSAVKFDKEGLYTIRAYSSTDGSKFSSDYAEFTLLITKAGSASETSAETRRASYEVIKNIANFEGFLPTIYYDTLANNVPTVGYGYVVPANTTFYNSVTKTEALALLIENVNSNYSVSIENMRKSNGMKMNQHQFDGLVSFIYNCGAGAVGSSMGTGTVLRNAVDPTEVKKSAKSAYNNSGSSVRMYSNPSASSSVVNRTIPNGGSVRVSDFATTSNSAELWYKVTYSGTTGWVRAGNFRFNDNAKMTHDLAYVDGITFGNNLLLWNAAGGVRYVGLLHRRLAEGRIFSYGDYAGAYNNGSAAYYRNPGYSIPSGICSACTNKKH